VLLYIYYCIFGAPTDGGLRVHVRLDDGESNLFKTCVASPMDSSILGTRDILITSYDKCPLYSIFVIYG